MITLTKEELNEILEFLATRPLKETYVLFQKLVVKAAQAEQSTNLVEEKIEEPKTKK